MNTYQELLAGRLSGVKRLAISAALEDFPEEIFALSDTLEILDLSRNRLSTLPDDFGRLKKLKILFLSENRFTEIPKVLSDCPALTMIGFKSNRITEFREDVLPPETRWLILTDNRIGTLPDSIGELDKLQKLMLAGNRIVRLPESMRQCRNLELLRLSANQLEDIPDWLFSLPRLSWLACSGNPCTPGGLPDDHTLADIAWEDVSIHEQLGEGASGIISKGMVPGARSAAIKVFRGEMTSDGYPLDEVAASIAAGTHPNLNTPHGRISNHPEEKEALVFPLIPPVYCNLGNPPSFESCTRDTYDEEARFPLHRLLRIASDVCSAACHLHERGINHGDLYAHNILVDKEGHSMLGDFGAATRYERSAYGDAFEHLEVRAFGCLLEELLDRCEAKGEKEKGIVRELERLKVMCMTDAVAMRPSFDTVYGRLKEAVSQLETEAGRTTSVPASHP